MWSGYWKETAAHIVMLFLLYRLVGCNIALMKRFLPLLMLTGLLFGQDGLILKSGEVYNGTFIRNVDELIVFQVEGKNHFTPFPILDVETIVTKSGEFTYPFDIPTKQEEDVSRILGYRPKSKIGQVIYGRFVLGMGVSCVMVLAILLALALGLPHPGM